VSPDRVELAPLEIVTRSGSLTATGRFEVAERRFSVAAQGRDLDPGLFAAAWPGRINAAGNVSGVLEPVIEVDFEDLTLDGRVRDYPFTAALDGRFRAPGSFTFEQAEIVSGQDRVTFAGTVDETIALTLEAHAEQLDLLWPELDGVIDANLTLPVRPPRRARPGRSRRLGSRTAAMRSTRRAFPAARSSLPAVRST
jgi:hypothetical protein